MSKVSAHFRVYFKLLPLNFLFFFLERCLCVEIDFSDFLKKAFLKPVFVTLLQSLFCLWPLHTFYTCLPPIYCMSVPHSAAIQSDLSPKYKYMTCGVNTQNIPSEKNQFKGCTCAKNIKSFIVVNHFVDFCSLLYFVLQKCVIVWVPKIFPY